MCYSLLDDEVIYINIWMCYSGYIKIKESNIDVFKLEFESVR